MAQTLTTFCQEKSWHYNGHEVVAYIGDIKLYAEEFENLLVQNRYKAYLNFKEDINSLQSKDFWNTRIGEITPRDWLVNELLKITIEKYASIKLIQAYGMLEGFEDYIEASKKNHENNRKLKLAVEDGRKIYGLVKYTYDQYWNSKFKEAYERVIKMIIRENQNIDFSYEYDSIKELYPPTKFDTKVYHLPNDLIIEKAFQFEGEIQKGDVRLYLRNALSTPSPISNYPQNDLKEDYGLDVGETIAFYEKDKNEWIVIEKISPDKFLQPYSESEIKLRRHMAERMFTSFRNQLMSSMVLERNEIHIKESFDKTLILH